MDSSDLKSIKDSNKKEKLLKLLGFIEENTETLKEKLRLVLLWYPKPPDHRYFIIYDIAQAREVIRDNYTFLIDNVERDEAFISKEPTEAEIKRLMKRLLIFCAEKDEEDKRGTGRQHLIGLMAGRPRKDVERFMESPKKNISVLELARECRGITITNPEHFRYRTYPGGEKEALLVSLLSQEAENNCQRIVEALKGSQTQGEQGNNQVSFPENPNSSSSSPGDDTLEIVDRMVQSIIELSELWGKYPLDRDMECKPVLVAENILYFYFKDKVINILTLLSGKLQVYKSDKKAGKNPILRIELIETQLKACEEIILHFEGTKLKSLEDDEEIKEAITYLIEYPSLIREH